MAFLETFFQRSVWRKYIYFLLPRIKPKLSLGDLGDLGSLSQQSLLELLFLFFCKDVIFFFPSTL